MASTVTLKKTRPHAVCVPYPTQGHVNSMLKLAKLLHHSDFHITFVNSEYNHRRLLHSLGSTALQGLPDFRFATIPDGLPPSNADATQDIPSLCVSTATTCLEPFCRLLADLNVSGGPPVTCIVGDGIMSFTLKAAERFGLPEVLYWTASACGLLGYAQYRRLVERGYTPLKDMDQVTNGFLNTTIDWVPGIKDFKLRDIPSFIRTTDPNDILLNFLIQETDAVPRAKALIINTFDALEHEVLDALSSLYPCVLPIGPLHLMTQNIPNKQLDTLKSSLWREDSSCIEWLDKQEPHSVVYVNFGSVTVVTAQQLTEFAWGLANSNYPFLWVVRPDIMQGDLATLPSEFLDETKDRSVMISWCPQEQVLSHPAVGGFLTHSGWNSTLDSIVGGVPMLCWPFFADQQTNCRFSCVEWGIGKEIDSNVKKSEVEALVREMMGGMRMKEKALEWKAKAEAATQVGGPSYLNLHKLINELL